MTVPETVTGTFTVKITETVTVNWSICNFIGEVDVMVAVADSKLIQ